MNQRFKYGSLGPIAYPTYPSGKRSSCPSMMTVFHQRVTKINCILAFKKKMAALTFSEAGTDNLI